MPLWQRKEIQAVLPETTGRVEITFFEQGGRPVSKNTDASARFTLGCLVRVRSGTKDPDFPDIPIGGWAGKIIKVEAVNPPCYLIRWNQQTLASIPSVYRNRCERDGLDFEEMWLGDDDLEPDSGGAVILEQPTRIVTPPLSMKDQDDRIRAVFVLTRDDLLPNVNEASLRIYRKHLVANLVFPFTATWVPESEFKRIAEMVKVHALNGFENDQWCDETYGLFCKAESGRGRIEVPLAEQEKVKGKPNAQILSDYRYWICNHQ